MRQLVVIMAFFVLSHQSAHAQGYGAFDSQVQAEWGGNGRSMTLLRDLKYTDPKGRVWLAHKGAEVDGASIPPFAWSFIGGPFEGKYRDASVIHDVACVQKKMPWEDVHFAFYTGMLASGVQSFKAKIMYLAVYHFGPKWATPLQRARAKLDLDKKIAQLKDIGNVGHSIVVPASEEARAAEDAMKARVKQDVSESDAAFRLMYVDTPPVAPSNEQIERFNAIAAEIEVKEGTAEALSLDEIRAASVK